MDHGKAIIHARTLDTILDLAEDMEELGLDSGDFGPVLDQLRQIRAEGPRFEADYDELNRQLTGALSQLASTIESVLETAELDPVGAGDRIWEATAEAEAVLDALQEPTRRPD